MNRFVIQYKYIRLREKHYRIRYSICTKLIAHLQMLPVNKLDIVAWSETLESQCK